MTLVLDVLPPSYTAAIASEARAPRYQDITERVPSFQYFHRTPHGIRIFDCGNAKEPRYYVRSHQMLGHPDIMLYNGNDRDYPATGQATFSPVRKDFVIAVDGPASSNAPQQEVVRYYSDHRILGTESYHFTVPRARQLEGDQCVVANLAWKHTHYAHLGSAAWTSRDFQLINTITAQILAIYISWSESDNVMSRLEWLMPCTIDEETRALVVLMALVERSRRDKKWASRAIALKRHSV